MMTKGNILNLLEQYEDLTSTFDNFLNGKFEVLQKQINKMQEQLSCDLFFTDQKVYQQIRNKNLQQYVAPYKVIDIKEIAKAFGVTLETVEADLA